jgi:hypothetical protein
MIWPPRLGPLGPQIEHYQWSRICPSCQAVGHPSVVGWWQTGMVGRRKPIPPVLAALVVAHVSVTTITWRDLSHRSADQLHGPKWFWRAFTGIQMGNSAVAR